MNILLIALYLYLSPSNFKVSALDRNTKNQHKNTQSGNFHEPFNTIFFEPVFGKMVQYQPGKDDILALCPWQSKVPAVLIDRKI
jgi:hypothetical protein